jgi:hypothetical protein
MTLYIPAPPGRPWRHESELALLRDWFYPNKTIADPYATPEPDPQQSAIDKVNLYISRDRKTPHALIATAQLTEALLHDALPERRKLISHGAMVSIYAMAFMKFVNGFVDRDIAKKATASLTIIQALESSEGASEESEDDDEQGYDQDKVLVKRGGESSMFAYAAKIDMPEDHVDLRHQIVHGRITELWLLKQKTEEALEWLWEKWWKVNATGDPARAMRARVEARLEMERWKDESERKRREKVEENGDGPEVRQSIEKDDD